MALHKVQPIKLDDQVIEVLVDSDGLFRANVHGDLKDTTYEGLRKKILANLRSKRIKISLPFSILDGQGSGSVKSGVITGRFTTSRNLIVKWDDGKKGSLDRHSLFREVRCKHLSDKETEEFLKLVKARNDAIGKIDEFINNRRADIASIAEQMILKESQKDAEPAGVKGKTDR